MKRLCEALFCLAELFVLGKIDLPLFWILRRGCLSCFEFWAGIKQKPKSLSYWTLRSKVKYPRMVSFLYNLYGYFAFYKGSIWQNSPSFSSGFFARLTHSKWQEFAVFASGFYRTLQGVAVAKNTTAVILSDSEKSTCKDGTALSFWAECVSTKRKIQRIWNTLWIYGYFANAQYDKSNQYDKFTLLLEFLVVKHYFLWLHHAIFAKTAR